MHKCARCFTVNETVSFSSTLNGYYCDDCYTEINDEKEDAAIASCYPIEEQRMSKRKEQELIQRIATAQDEIAKRLDHYEKLLPFVQELANWDATCDSWYDLFKSYQKQAKELL